jgi:hypothetical protein
MAPARYSPRASAPTIAKTAMRSTPSSRRSSPRMTETIVAVRTSAVVMAHTHRAAAPRCTTCRRAPAAKPRQGESGSHRLPRRFRLRAHTNNRRACLHCSLAERKPYPVCQLECERSVVVFSSRRCSRALAR